MEEFLNNFRTAAAGQITDFCTSFFYAVLLVFIGSRIIKKGICLMCKSKWYSRIDINIQAFLKSCIKLILYVVLLISAAAIIGIPAASLITMLASAGVAVGLALQGALGNLAGGVIILFFKPFKVGDMIEADGNTGIVTAITVFYTILTTLDNKRITLPNGNLTNSAITNYSAEPIRRIDLVFKVDYNTDIQRVKDLILDVTGKNPLVLKNPAAIVRVTAHGESSLDFAVQVWCNTQNYWSVFYDMNEDVKTAFDKNGIKIPYPHLHIVDGKN